MKHTKEPWRVVSDVPVMAIYSEPEDYRVVQTVNQNNFNTYGKSRVDVGIYKQEDAERIVACVNACAGITNDALEAGYIKHLVEWDEVNHNCIDIVDSVKTPFEFKGVPIKERGNEKSR